MACCLTASSHYLNQCWLIINGVLWYSPYNNFTSSAWDISSWYEFENYNFEIMATSPRGQWVNQCSSLVPRPGQYNWAWVIIPLAQRRCWGVYWFHSVRLSVRPSVPRPSRIPCPLCSFYSSGWIHFIFIHLIKQLQKVCRVQSLLQNFKIWSFGNFLRFVTLTLCCFDLGSNVNH